MEWILSFDEVDDDGLYFFLFIRSFCHLCNVCSIWRTMQWYNIMVLLNSKLSHKFNQIALEFLFFFIHLQKKMEIWLCAQFAQVETNGRNANVFYSQFAKLFNSSLSIWCCCCRGDFFFHSFYMYTSFDDIINLILYPHFQYVWLNIVFTIEFM